eukprot:11825109-Ditylum_brightwellii.AAC.1
MSVPLKQYLPGQRRKRKSIQIRSRIASVSAVLLWRCLYMLWRKLTGMRRTWWWWGLLYYMQQVAPHQDSTAYMWYKELKDEDGVGDVIQGGDKLKPGAEFAPFVPVGVGSSAKI